MFSKEEINQAISVVKEEIQYYRETDPSAYNEIDLLEFLVSSLEGYRDREEFAIWLAEQEQALNLQNNRGETNETTT